MAPIPTLNTELLSAWRSSNLLAVAAVDTETGGPPVSVTALNFKPGKVTPGAFQVCVISRMGSAVVTVPPVSVSGFDALDGVMVCAAVKVLAPSVAPAAADTHVVPLLVSTLPLVPGATNCTAEVPLPRRTLLAVRVVAPVPPLATASVADNPADVPLMLEVR